MMQQPRLVNFLALLWLASYSGLVWAASTFAQDVRAFDYESLGWAAAAGLFGGAARTILSLASDKVVVGYIWRETIKDWIVALVGGAVVFLLVEGLATMWPEIFVRQVRMLCIVGAGFSRGKWSSALSDLVSDGLGNLRNRVRAPGVAPVDAPSSATLPLADK